MRRRHAWNALSPHTALLPVLLAGVALRVDMLRSGVPTLDSDEAIIGLMALHLLHGDWSTYFWGQSYMGSLEAVLIAPFIWAFGVSAFTLRLAPLLIGAAFIVTVYALGVRLYHRGVALVAALLLAVGSPFFVVLSIRAYGGYVETLLFGNLLLLIALHDSPSAARRRAWLVVQGLLAGLALWTDLLILPYFVAVGALYWWRRRADVLGRNGALASASLLGGAAPAVAYNLTHAGATFTTIAGLTVAGAHGARSGPGPLLANVLREALVSLPMVVGSFIGGVHATGLTEQEIGADIQTHTAAYALDLLLAMLALACLASVAVRLLRSRRVVALVAVAPPSGALALERTASAVGTKARVRWQGEAALLIVVACYLGAFSLTKDPLVFTTPRYLLPVYSATPLVVAELGRFAGRLRGLGAGWGQRIGLVVPVVFVAALLAWNATGDLALTPLQTAARDHSVWISGQDHALLQVLRTHDVHTVISNDYWFGLRLTFESDEDIITAMITPSGKPGFNRYQPYVQRGLRDPVPAYVEITGTTEARLDLIRLRTGELAHYESLQVGKYTVFVPSDQALHRILQ